MEDAENLILSQIRLLKAIFKNFSAEDVDEECINIEEIAESEYKKDLEEIHNVVLEKMKPKKMTRTLTNQKKMKKSAW